MRLHRLSEPAKFERALRSYRDLIERTKRRLAEGGGRQQSCYQTLMLRSLSTGCIGLILSLSDERVIEDFGSAAGYALEMIRVQASPGTLRSYEAHVRVSERGSRITALHERPSQEGSGHLSITEFHRALFSIVAFGEHAAIREVARLPEERYRNPDVVAPEDYWCYLRAWKALLNRDESTARAEANRSMVAAADEGPRAQSAALLALLANDETTFTESVLAGLQAHRKRYEKEPGNPMGVVCFPGLMLCRLARDRGMRVEDQPYVPVRLLPREPALT